MSSPGRHARGRRRGGGAPSAVAAGAPSAVAAAVAGLSLLAAACGGATAAKGASGNASHGRGHGPVAVLYAGSLTNLMERRIGPAFSSATGYSFSGFAGGSTELAHEIAGGVRRGDVFVSASPSVNDSLMGKAHGSWVDWYATFATAPLVLAFDPHSRFASQLRDRPWQQVVTEPGFRLGRTDPALDPKGKLTVEAIRQAAKLDHDPALLGLLGDTSGVFPEASLLGRLQAGQLDAGFFYSNEAKEAKLPTVSLSPVRLGATYTVTVLEGAPDAGGADSFVHYLFSGRGRAALTADGLTLTRPPAVHGASAVPSTLRSVLGLR